MIVDVDDVKVMDEIVIMMQGWLLLIEMWMVVMVVMVEIVEVVMVVCVIVMFV